MGVTEKISRNTRELLWRLEGQRSSDKYKKNKTVLTQFGLPEEVADWATRKLIRHGRLKHYYMIWGMVSFLAIAVLFGYSDRLVGHSAWRQSIFPAWLTLYVPGVVWAAYLEGSGRWLIEQCIHLVFLSTEMLAEAREQNWLAPRRENDQREQYRNREAASNIRSNLELAAWTLARECARLGCNKSSARTDEEWSRVSRALAYAAEKPWDLERNRFALIACVSMIEHLRHGNLLEPIELPNIKSLPILPVPPGKQRVRRFFSEAFTGSVIVSALAALAAAVLTVVFR